MSLALPPLSVHIFSSLIVLIVEKSERLTITIGVSARERWVNDFLPWHCIPTVLLFRLLPDVDSPVGSQVGRRLLMSLL